MREDAAPGEELALRNRLALASVARAEGELTREIAGSPELDAMEREDQ